MTSEQTNGVGRPKADMLLYALKRLGVNDPRQTIKVGDTVNDILEAKQAHAIAVGVVVGGNQVGLSEKEYDLLSASEKRAVTTKAASQLKAAGADYVISNIDDLIRLIPALDIIEANRPTPEPILLTPGPLTTSETVKSQMLVDHGTWDDEYKRDTQAVRAELLKLANAPQETTPRF